MQGLPVSHYTDSTRAPLEAAAVFAASWQFVCHASDLPATGTAVRFDCAGRSAVVLRTRDGSLHAFRNACRHRGARLVEGDAHTGLAFCIDARLRCPYHGWTYDEAGALASIPEGMHFDASFDAAQHALYPVHVAQWRSLVFVAFETPRDSLTSALDDVAGSWPDCSALRRVIEPRATACSADWKLAAEHLVDTAHFDVARPGFKPQVFAPPVFEPGTGAGLAARSTLAEGGGSGGSWSARVYRQLLQHTPTAQRDARYAFLWPNTLLQLAPDGLSVLQVLPQATVGCTYRELRYAQPDASRAMRLLRYVHHRVRRQALTADVRLLARVQAGMTDLAPTEAGLLASNEIGRRWFATRYRACLPAESPASKPATTRQRSRAKAAATIDG